ncbi:MAG: DUF4157 domain-containing protein [Gemmatimonadaceae bacterium]
MTRRSTPLPPTHDDGALRRRAQKSQSPRATTDDVSSPLVALQQAAGNFAVARLATANQKPSSIDAADSLERQADAVANEVVGADLPLSPAMQASQGVPPAATATPRVDGVPESVQSTLRSPGRPLDPGTRAHMESQFGRDFSQVQLHADEDAAQSAREVSAHAYTVGSHIVFDSDRLSPHSDAGQRLLAHELTHVVQQAASPSSPAGSPALQKQSQSRDEMEKQLAEVRKELSSGSGVRSNEATNKLKEEEQRLSAALEQLTAQELRNRLAANQKQQATGSGVRSPQAAAELRDDQRRLEAQLGVGAGATGTALTGMKQGGPTAPLKAPFVDWGAGNNRGLGAELTVADTHYPGATQLPKGFPGADLVTDGTRTPLTGFGGSGKGKLPLSADSTYVEGGTIIQVKTLTNASSPGYQEPGAVLKQLEKGMEALANVKPGAGKSEKAGSEFRRVELGQPTKRILHVEMEAPPTPDQLAQLEQLKVSGKSYGAFGPGEEVEVVVSWPGTPPKSFFRNIEMAPGSAGGAANLALAGLGAYARNEWREHQLKTEGYAAKGTAAHLPGSAGGLEGVKRSLEYAGAAARGDSFDMASSAPTAADFNVVVWQARVREITAGKKPGDTLTVVWQKAMSDSETVDIEVTYEKLPDGSWRAGPPSDTPAGFKVPDINRIIAPGATNIDVERELGIKSA